MGGLKITEAKLWNLEEELNKFEEDAENHKANLILFLADIDPCTNLSWCPDCVRAEPVIYKTLEESGVALLRVYVGDRHTWRNPQHPLRVDPRFCLNSVPTLLRWQDKAATARLEDHHSHIPSHITALLA